MNTHGVEEPAIVAVAPYSVKEFLKCWKDFSQSQQCDKNLHFGNIELVLECWS